LLQTNLTRFFRDSTSTTFVIWHGKNHSLLQFFSSSLPSYSSIISNKNRTLPGDIPPVSGQVNAPLLFIGDIRIGEIELSTDAPDEVKLHLFFNDKEIPLSQASYGIQKMNLRADGEVERVQLEELLPDVGQTMLAESAQQGSSIIPPNAETLSNQSGVVHNPLPWAIPFYAAPGNNIT
jgi:hypothetical protein